MSDKDSAAHLRTERERKLRAITHLSTERLILRHWQESDAPALYRYASDPLVGPPAGWPPHTDPEESKKILLNALMRPDTFAICLAADGGAADDDALEAIGSISLIFDEMTDMTDRADECELGYWIGRRFWGQGLMPEAGRELLRFAFCELGVRTVWCGYYDGNERSHRVQEKLGFIYHHTTPDVQVPQLNTVRVGHVSRLTREHYIEIYSSSDIDR